MSPHHHNPQCQMPSTGQCPPNAHQHHHHHYHFHTLPQHPHAPPPPLAHRPMLNSHLHPIGGPYPLAVPPPVPQEGMPMMPPAPVSMGEMRPGIDPIGAAGMPLPLPPHFGMPAPTPAHTARASVQVQTRSFQIPSR